MKRAVQHLLLRALPPLDVVWDFDCNLLYRDLAWFRAPLKIYQPVDQVSGENPTTKNADAIFSISAVILDIFRTNTANSVPLHLLHHGLGVVFADVARRKAATEILYQPATPLRFCYVGNLLLKFIDADAIEAVVTAMPTVEFHFIGPHSGANNNVAAFTDGNDRMQAFVAFLKAQPNVVLHGAKKQTEMIDIMEQQDGFFLCYDNTRDPNKGSNSHKLMEYLSFGKVVVSTFVSSYRGSDVLTMLPEATSTNPDNRQAYLALFEDVVTNITTYNHPDTQKARIAFALHNTYAGQVEVVSEKIKALG